MSRSAGARIQASAPRFLDRRLCRRCDAATRGRVADRAGTQGRRVHERPGSGPGWDRTSWTAGGASLVGPAARHLYHSLAPWRWRDGRSLSSIRRDARARGRDQGPAASVHRRCAADRALRTRSTDARDAESSTHRARSTASRKPDGGARARAGAGRRRDARGSDRPRVRLGADARSPKSSVLRARSRRRSTPRTKRASSTGILKPANIKITPDGVVKVLDFGLAKVPVADGARPDVTETLDGAILGTAAYMSPEQARGQPSTSAQISGPSGVSSTRCSPAVSRFRATRCPTRLRQFFTVIRTGPHCQRQRPASVRRLLPRCLAKNLKQRLRDIGDVRIELDAVDDSACPGSPTTQHAQRQGRSALDGCPGSRSSRSQRALVSGKRHDRLLLSIRSPMPNSDA